MISNEALVKRIQDGISVTDNLQLLYDKNLPLIKKICKPYTAYESLEDLLQESFFGLWQATKNYESSENVKFMTYATCWIKQSVVSYIERCGSLVRLPNHVNNKILRYKRTVEQLQMELINFSDSEIAKRMGITLKEVDKLKMYCQSISSLDTPLTDGEEVTLRDTVKADLDVENSVIDKMYDEYCKSELWGIIEHYTLTLENNVIKDYFAHNKSMLTIAKERNLTVSQIRRIKEEGLRRLRIGKAKKALATKLYVEGSRLYHTGKANFDRHFCSQVERVAIANVEIEQEIKELDSEG